MKMDSKRKALHVCSEFSKGGIYTFIKSMIQANAESSTRHDLAVLFENQIDLIADADVFCFGAVIKNPFKFFLKMKKIIKDYQSVMLHKAHPIVVFPLIFTKKKIYIFQHGMAVSRGSFFKRNIKKAWYSLIPGILNAKVICSTEYAFNKTLRNGIRISRRRCEIIPFGTRINRKARESQLQKILKTELNIGSAGVLVKIKRFNLLIESLIGYSGDLKINLKIIGEGPEKKPLLDLISKATSENVSIELPGYIRETDAFYDSLDLFVFPSHDESFGLVVLEALSRGVPVAVFRDLGGALTLIHNELNGFIMDGGRAGLQKLWQKLNENPFILQEMENYIGKMDLSQYEIKSTRMKLDSLLFQD
jgi:glycosyltransferase involved in cell wall biosynthesis